MLSSCLELGHHGRGEEGPFGNELEQEEEEEREEEEEEREDTIQFTQLPTIHQVAQ